MSKKEEEEGTTRAVKKGGVVDGRLKRVMPTTDEIGTAITEAGGNLSGAAKQLCVGRTWLYDRIHESEELEAGVLSARERTLDTVEQTLVDMATSGHDIAATIFYLKTQGRSRNFNERHQIDVTGTMESREKDATADAAYLAAVLSELSALSGASDVIDGEVIPPLLSGESESGGATLAQDSADEADR